MPNKIKTKEQIKNGSDKVVEIPGWGTHIRIKKMSVDDRDRFGEIINDEPDTSMARVHAEFVYRCCVEPQFDDIDDAAEMPNDGAEEAFDAIMAHSNMNRTVDEAEKNSETTISDSSDTDLQPISDGVSEK